MNVPVFLSSLLLCTSGHIPAMTVANIGLYVQTMSSFNALVILMKLFIKIHDRDLPMVLLLRQQLLSLIGDHRRRHWPLCCCDNA